MYVEREERFGLCTGWRRGAVRSAGRIRGRSYCVWFGWYCGVVLLV